MLHLNSLINTKQAMTADNINGTSHKKPIATSWIRPSEPINVWRIIKATKQSGDNSEQVRLSIQDIPEDRYDEAVNFMCEYFIEEEVTCKSLKINEDEDAVNDYRSIWYYLLSQNISVGAFVLDSNGSLGELAGMNVLYVATEETDKTLDNMTINFKSSKLRKKFVFMHDIYEKADVRGIYGVNMYLGALGLAVKHAFRGQRLGVHLLEARNDVGRKYGITATSTLFMGPSSQIQAERAGFITAVSLDYAEVTDDNGRLMFPDIEAKVIKAMVKELR